MTEEVIGWVLDKKVRPGQHLAQGDLIVFPESKDALRKVGLVVTADCDLEKRKHGRLVTLVPVVTVKSILENYLLIEACEKQKDGIFSYVCKSFSIEYSGDESLAIAELRSKLDAAKVDKIQRIAAEFILHRLNVLSWADYKSLMDAIKSKEKAASAIESQLKDKGDIVILPSPSKLGVEGDIAWVRQIWQVPLGDIAIRTSDVKDLPGERIARLDSPYRYRLTQVMAQVFSDIGLPDVRRDFKSDIEGVIGNA